MARVSGSRPARTPPSVSHHTSSGPQGALSAGTQTTSRSSNFELQQTTYNMASYRMKPFQSHQRIQNNPWDMTSLKQYPICRRQIYLTYLVPPPSEPATAAADQAEEAVQTDPYELHPKNTSVEYHLNVHSPTYNKTVIQSQHSFGMTPEQWMQPPVNAPVRKQHRSRTPASRTPRSIRGQPTTPALGDAAGQAAASTSAQPLLPPQEQADQPSAPTPGLPSSVMPEVIDIEAIPDTQDPALGSIVPTTPPELAGDTPSNKRASTEMEQPIPSQPSYKALLQQHTKQQQIDQDTYHLHGYKNMAKAADHTLQVWARRDTAAQVLQTTHFCGPPKWSIKHRRVLTYPEGKLIWDAPYSDDQQGHHLFPQRTDIITELWHDNHADYYNLVVSTDGIQQQDTLRRHRTHPHAIQLPHSLPSIQSITRVRRRRTVKRLRCLC